MWKWCQRSAENAWDGEQRKELLSFKSGGNVISIVAKPIIVVPQGQWMPLVCCQFSNVLWKIIVCYTEFLGDGDSKAHKLIVEQAVYGDVEVKKLECVGHFQKGLGSRLCSLKKRAGHLEDGKTLRGTGRLSETRINKLKVYYGNAIRENTHDLEAIQNAVMAIWHHSHSTDESPGHNLCPAGENSWCGFQQDLAKGTSDYKHQHPLPKLFTLTV